MSILDQIEVIEETPEQVTYIENDTLMLDSTGDHSESIDELSREVVFDEQDTENPKQLSYRAFLIRRIYGPMDIREWII